MYIEFRIEKDLPGFIHQPHLVRMLEDQVDDWAKVNDIKYTSKYYKNTFRVGFDNDSHFTVFRLTWTDLPYIEYKIIDNKW